MAAHGVCVSRVATDAIVAGKIFSSLDHAADDPKAFDRLGHDAPPRQPVMQRQIPEAHALPNVCGVMFDIGHALHAARHHNIGCAGLHHHCSVDHGLKAGTAPPVHLVTGHVERQACRQPAPMANSGGLAAAIALAEDHIVHSGRIDPAAFDQGFQDHRTQWAGFD